MESAEAEPSDSRPEEDGAAPCSGLPPPEQLVATVRVRGVAAAGRRAPPRAAGLGTAYSAGAEHRAFLSVLPGRRSGAGGEGCGARPARGGRGRAVAQRCPPRREGATGGASPCPGEHGAEVCSPTLWAVGLSFQPHSGRCQGALCTVCPHP